MTVAPSAAALPINTAKCNSRSNPPTRARVAARPRSQYKRSGLASRPRRELHLRHAPPPCDYGTVSRKLMAVAGVALIVAGLLALAYQQVSYTTRETVVDVGPFEATAETEKTIPLSPIVGIAAVVSGVVLVVVSRRA